MRFFKFLFTLLLTLFLIFLLNKKNNNIPPLGKFLNPYHGFWQNAASEAIEGPESITLNGLNNKVTVQYDSNLIPHIFAENNHDLFYASGYVAAYHRLWQMELITHNAAGRLSEIIGPATLKIDREQRRIGMLTSAKKVLKEWQKHPEIKEMLEAYAKGVNAYINTLEYNDLPVEYKLLDYEPERWKTLKSALLLKYMSKLLTIGESDLENTNFVKKFGIKQFNSLFPDMPEGIDPVIPSQKTWSFTPETINPPDEKKVYLPYITDVMQKPYRGLGSNNWAISSEKSKSGNAMLANDMHLNLNLPSIWFVVQYHTPELNAFGHILPGAPMIIQGFNDSIAWGMTNANRDVVDWYNIKFRYNDKSEYFYDDKWLKTQKVVEEIKIRGQETIYDTVYYTHHGPIVYDDTFREDSNRVNLAMRWLAHEVSLEPLCFLKLLKANNYEDFKGAIKYFSCPPQNLIYAGASGDVAIHVQGKYPLKYADQGKFVLDGTTNKTEWKSFISFKENPQTYNPEQGFVSSANQHPVDSTYPYPTYSDNFEYFRNRRINQFISTRDSISVEDMMTLHTDNYSIKAEEALPLLLDSINSNNLDNQGLDILNSLRQWDYNYEKASSAAAYFEIWWKHLYKNLWDELMDQNVPFPHPSDYRTIQLLSKGQVSDFTDIQSTEQKESIKDVINYSFNQAIMEIGEMESEIDTTLTRKNYFNTIVEHYGKIKPFSISNIDIGGSGDVVNATTDDHGPSERIIIQFGDEVKAWHTYPGGQSGNPGNPHYDHFFESWKNGKYHEVLFMKDKDDASEELQFTQTFQPE